jgi:hypothetical protein
MAKWLTDPACDAYLSQQRGALGRKRRLWFDTLKELGWPEHTMTVGEATPYFLVAIPPAYKDDPNGAAVWRQKILNTTGILLSYASIEQEGTDADIPFLRAYLGGGEEVVVEAVRRLKAANIRYQQSENDNVAQELEKIADKGVSRNSIKDKLFRLTPTQGLLHVETPQPITTPLARYVLEDFPAQLAACVVGEAQLVDVARNQQDMLTHERVRIENPVSREAAHTAQLDLTMLLNGYLLERDNALKLAPSVLLQLLEGNAARYGFASRMTYELLVDVNTEAFIQTGGHIRTFSEGDVAVIERDFYIGHHFAEKHIKSAYETLRSILKEPGQPYKEERLAGVAVGLRRFTEYMSAYSRLPHEEYAYFRRFIAPYPDKVKNASGAFMPSPQLFEMLLHKPGYAQLAFLTDNERYFSQSANKDFRMAQNQAAAGDTVEDMIINGRLSLTKAEATMFRAIVEQFIQFKLTHIKVASSKIPEAFPKRPLLERQELQNFKPFHGANSDGVGKQEGSGGFRPQDFLGDGVRRLLELQQRLFRIS